jgi:flagellin-like protein
MKGISPLVASVLLIAITMAVAAVLANWVSSYTTDTISRQPCVGGSVNFVTADYPKWDSTNKVVKAAVEAQFVDLGDFKFDVIFDNDTVMTFDDTADLELASGSSGSITSTTVGGFDTDIKQVRISTNCSNVKTSWTNLR